MMDHWSMLKERERERMPSNATIILLGKEAPISSIGKGTESFAKLRSYSMMDSLDERHTRSHYQTKRREREMRNE